MSANGVRLRREERARETETCKECGEKFNPAYVPVGSQLCTHYRCSAAEYEHRVEAHEAAIARKKEREVHRIAKGIERALAGEETKKP